MGRSHQALGMVLGMLCVGALAWAEPLIKSGETLAFMGDSITQFGAGNPGGYVRLVHSGLAAAGIDVKIIPAGISGHKSNQMLARLDKDVLSKKPDWMTLSCGVNDVWHGARGVPLPEYKKNITEIVDKCEKAGVKVMILTSTPIYEQPNDLNTKLDGYNDFLKQLAKERNLPLADLNADMWKELKSPTHPRPTGNYLTRDGVHMNPLGDTVMAAGILRAFGLSDQQLATAEASWQDKTTALNVRANVTLAQYEQLAAIAAKEKKSVGNVLDQLLQDALAAKLTNGDAKP